MPIDEAVHTLTQCRTSFYKDYLLAFLMLYLIFILKLFNIPVSNIGMSLALILAAIFVISPEIERMRTTYTITKSQIIVEEGIFSRKRRSIFFDNVSDFSVHQSMSEKMMKYGTVVIGSISGRDYMELSLKNIKNPKEVVHKIERMIKEYIQGKQSASDRKHGASSNETSTEKAFNDLKNE